ncbi:MAG: two-component system, chemotaxis family, chemotaxis protein CheY [Gammaproteobacteria bacterium]|jgi:two-component system chemotaxis response regulator CheY|nr:two-component system, chemotaxis family, chemotaxis protein CheY [Gammaproteobacteria bacterium]
MAKKILIVDDSASVRTVARMALNEAGYEIIEAGNGQEALQKLSGERVHLIVSDVNMPIMDGITFLKEVKAHPKYKFTPVIMLTTEAGQDKKEAGRAAGAKAWITKPFQPRNLLDAVAKLILA